MTRHEWLLHRIGEVRAELAKHGARREWSAWGYAAIELEDLIEQEREARACSLAEQRISSLTRSDVEANPNTRCLKGTCS